jgi:hypothetical protein
LEVKEKLVMSGLKRRLWVLLKGVMVLGVFMGVISLFFLHKTTLFVGVNDSSTRDEIISVYGKINGARGYSITFEINQCGSMLEKACSGYSPHRESFTLIPYFEKTSDTLHVEENDNPLNSHELEYTTTNFRKLWQRNDEMKLSICYEADSMGHQVHRNIMMTLAKENRYFFSAH